MSQLRSFLNKETDQLDLKVDARAVPEVREILRRLDALGVLSEQMLAEILGASLVDPYGYITTLRTFKTEVGLREEEVVIGHTVVFQTEDKLADSDVPRATVDIDIFSNDLGVYEGEVLPHGDSRLKPSTLISGDILWLELKIAETGDARLNAYKRYISDALKFVSTRTDPQLSAPGTPLGFS